MLRGTSFGRRSFVLQTLAGVGALGLGGLLRAAVSRPRLSVILIAEQFRTDYLFRNLDSLGAGGFRRLLNEAAFFPDCRILSTTFTSSALATLTTGSYPDTHGVVADRWFDRATHQVVAAEGGQMLATTVFEQETDKRNRLFAIAGSEQRVGLLDPRRDATAFFRRPDGTFAMAFGKDAPAWLAPFQAAHSPEIDRNMLWMAHGAPVGTPALRVLRYDAARPDDYSRLLAQSPFAQSVELALLREIIARESTGGAGYDTVTAVLDSLGKLAGDVGAVSPLVDDEIVALDADIASLLSWLDQRGDSYQFIFTATHGAPEVPDAASHVRGEEIAAAVDQALAAEFAKGRAGIRFVEAFVYPFLYLRAEHIAAPDLPRARELAARAAMATGHVASFYTADGVCSHSGDWQTRLKHSSYGTRSGDVLLLYRPGLVEASAGDRGVSYGSPYAYDAQVPLFLKGPSFTAARFDHTVELIDIAPTLCAVAGTTLPSSATGRALAEAFGEFGRAV